MTSPAIIAAPSPSVDAEELGGTMMRKLTELFDEDEIDAYSRIAGRQAALIA